MNPLILTALLFAPGASAEVPAAGPGAGVETASIEGSMDPRFRDSGKEGFRKAILANRVSLDEWAARVNDGDMLFLCIGETHDTSFRKRLADGVFSRLRLDTLFFEALPGEFAEIVRKVDAGDETVKMLGADIAYLIRTAKRRNPDLRVAGVEQTREQELQQREDPRYTRDSFIAANIVSRIEPGRRHAALYGSLHCGRNSVSLGNTRPYYRHLLGAYEEERMSNVVTVMGGDWGNKFSVFMQVLGLNEESFVIPDTRRIDPGVYDFNWDLKRFFDNYRTIVYLAD